MGVKIYFYISVANQKNEELDLIEYYQNPKKSGYYIYTIEASEICSEFIARYFVKTKNMPDLLLNKVIEENYKKEKYEEAVNDLSNGIYKAKIDVMNKDNNSNFEFKANKECKAVRENLLNIYNIINCELIKNQINNPKMELYAILSV